MAEKATAKKVEVPEATKKNEKVDPLLAAMREMTKATREASGTQQQLLESFAEGLISELNQLGAVNTHTSDILTSFVVDSDKHPQIYAVTRDAASVVGTTIVGVGAYVGLKYAISAMGGDAIVDVLP